MEWADFNYFTGATATDFMPATLLRLPSRLGLTKDYLTPATNLRNVLNSDNAGQQVILGHTIPCCTAPIGAPQLTYLGHPASDPWHSSNNTSLNGKKDDSYFSFDRMDRVSNYMLLLSSDKGAPLGNKPTVVSRWPPERDLYNHRGTFYGVGRYLLFEVIRPSSGARLRISLTKSLSGGGNTALPASAEVDAAANQRIGFLGSGAANITTPPVQFYERNGRFYFALDFGTDGNYFPSHKTGLLRMFHTDIPVDDRQMVGFARDIALITESQYLSMERPTSITSWPAGLLSNPSLEFSGIYEDGWVSNRAFVVLGKAKAGDQLHITGQIPSLPGFVASGVDVSVLLNGNLIYKSHRKPGAFEVASTIVSDGTENRVDLIFDKMEHLPAGDDRPVSGQLFQIVIQGPGDATAHRPERERQAKLPVPALLPPPGQ